MGILAHCLFAGGLITYIYIRIYTRRRDNETLHALTPRQFPSKGDFMRVHVMNLQVGDLLIADVFNDFGLLVMSKDRLLTAKDIDILVRHNIQYVDIAFRNSIDLPIGGPEENLEAISEEMDNAVQGVRQLFEQVAAEGKIDETIVNEHFEPLTEHFQKEHDVVSLLLMLSGKDEYTYSHSVQVGMLCYYIAVWAGHTEEEALEAGKGGYLHDIGKSRIPSEILNKPGKLTKEEFDLVKRHTNYGYEIISKSLRNPEAPALVALQHHERFDGSGYPYGASGERIHPYAKICAIADIYSAMISTRVYREKRDLLNVLRELHQLSFSELDPHITLTFIRHMVPNFIGKKAVLKSGEVGEIIMTNQNDLFRPLIRIGDKFIDLSRARELEVYEIVS